MAVFVSPLADFSTRRARLARDCDVLRRRINCFSTSRCLSLANNSLALGPLANVITFLNVSWFIQLYLHRLARLTFFCCGIYDFK